MKERIKDKDKKVLLSSPATLGIIAINIVFFIALNIIPNIANELLLNPELNMIIARPWTLLTVFFSNEVPAHLLANMGLFFIFGINLERVAGSKAVYLVYLVAGFAGSLAFIPFAPLVGWTGPVAGASAAVWGVASSFGAVYPNAIILGSKAKHWVLALFIGNAILFILNPEVSVGAGAHVTGIVVGLICGFWLRKKE